MFILCRFVLQKDCAAAYRYAQDLGVERRHVAKQIFDHSDHKTILIKCLSKQIKILLCEIGVHMVSYKRWTVRTEVHTCITVGH